MPPEDHELEPIELVVTARRINVEELSGPDKLHKAAQWGLEDLPKASKAKIQDLLSQEALVTMGLIGGAWAGFHLLGVGFAADTALAVIGGITLAQDAVEVTKKFSAFLTTAWNAKTLEELEQAEAIFEDLASSGSLLALEKVLISPAFRKAADLIGDILKRLPDPRRQTAPVLATTEGPLPDGHGQLPEGQAQRIQEGGRRTGSNQPDEPPKKPDDVIYVANRYPRTPEEYEALAQDPAHRNSKNPNDIKKARQERKIAIELENSGQLAGPVVRDRTGDAEFINIAGQKWDIKGFNSYEPPRKGGYKLEDSLEKIQKEFRKNENVILDTTNLKPGHAQELYRAIQERGWSDKILWYDPDGKLQQKISQKQPQTDIAVSLSQSQLQTPDPSPVLNYVSTHPTPERLRNLIAERLGPAAAGDRSDAHRAGKPGSTSQGPQEPGNRAAGLEFADHPGFRAASEQLRSVGKQFSALAGATPGSASVPGAVERSGGSSTPGLTGDRSYPQPPGNHPRESQNPELYAALERIRNSADQLGSQLQDTADADFGNQRQWQNLQNRPDHSGPQQQLELG